MFRSDFQVSQKHSDLMATKYKPEEAIANSTPQITRLSNHHAARVVSMEFSNRRNACRPHFVPKHHFVALEQHHGAAYCLCSLSSGHALCNDSSSRRVISRHWVREEGQESNIVCRQRVGWQQQRIPM